MAANVARRRRVISPRMAKKLQQLDVAALNQEVADLRTRLEASEAAVSHLEWQKKSQKGGNKKPRRGAIFNKVLNIKFPSSASKQQGRHNALNEC